MDKTSRVDTNKRRNSQDYLRRMEGIEMFQKVKEVLMSIKQKAVELWEDKLSIRARQERTEAALAKIQKQNEWFAEVSKTEDMTSVFAKTAIELGWMPMLDKKQDMVDDIKKLIVPELVAPKLERAVL